MIPTNKDLFKARTLMDLKLLSEWKYASWAPPDSEAFRTHHLRWEVQHVALGLALDLLS